MKGNYCNNSPFMKLKDVSFSYPNGDLIFTDICLHLYQNEFIAVIGTNGSGKTTLGKMLVGILKPTTGVIYLKGEDISRFSPGKIGRQIAYLFQQPERQLFAPTVEEEIAFALNFMGENRKVVEKKVNKMIELFSLQGLEGYSPYKLSRGERQRLALAAILVNEPDFLVLDEPTTGLDLIRKNKLSEVLKKLQDDGLGLVVISHDENFVHTNADRIIEVTGGGIVESGSQN